MRALRALPALLCPRPGLCGARHGRERVGLATAATTRSTAVRGAVTALFAAAHKLVCEATRIGVPGNVVVMFVAAGCACFPQRLADIPGHLALTLAAASLAWMACMAPGPVRSQEPQPSGGGQGPGRCRTARSHSGRRPCPCPGLPSFGRGSSRSLAHGVAGTRPLPGAPGPGTAAGHAESGMADHRELACSARLLRTTAPLRTRRSPQSSSCRPRPGETARCRPAPSAHRRPRRWNVCAR